MIHRHTDNYEFEYCAMPDSVHPFRQYSLRAHKMNNREPNNKKTTTTTLK